MLLMLQAVMLGTFFARLAVAARFVVQSAGAAHVVVYSAGERALSGS
jgi:hypothetical protein